MAIALYARKSIEKENSISCETQLMYCRSAISLDEKNEKIITFVDNGFSGGNTDRDGFMKMMKMVSLGKISKVIVYRLDRISRSLADFVKILGTFKEHGVKFVSSQEAFDTSSVYGEMIVKILMVFAEFERQSIIERVTQAYAHRSEKGFYMGGRTPYGFTLCETEIGGVKTKMFCPKEIETEQIKYIFDNYQTEGMTLRRLMDNLNKNNILPSEGSWSTAKLSTILKNPVYVRADNRIYEYFLRKNANIISDISEFDGIHGIQIYGKTKHTADDFSDMKIVVMSHEGLIDSDVWLKCIKKLEKNKQIGNSISNTTSWLGGKIICKSCGRTMTVTKGGKHEDGSRTRYFSCTGKSHNRICKGTAVTLYADSLEDMVYNLIDEKLLEFKNFKTKISTDNSGKINLLKNRLSEIKAEEAKIADILISEKLEPELIKIMNEKAANLSSEKKSLLQKIETLENEESEIVNVLNLSKKWHKATYEEKKAVLGILIDKIYIHTDGTAEVIWNI